MLSGLSPDGADMAEALGSPLSSAISARDRNIVETVRSALKDRRVALAFQPIVRAKEPDKAAFYEGLIRIMDDTGRIIPAGEFIDVVEDTQLGRIIDCFAVELGLQALAQDPSLRLSINMSARSVGYSRWVKTLEHGCSIDPALSDRLILEITESSAMIMPELVVSFMTDLQRRGVAFALDDFGAGNTAFRFLKDFFFDAVKIDGQFVRGIATDPDNQVLARALVSIANHFDMFTVAESVENADDVQFLQSIGVDFLQGYFFGAPTVMSPAKLHKLNCARA